MLKSCFTNITIKSQTTFSLSHRGSYNAPLVIVFSANYIDQSNRDFYATEGISEAWPLDLSRLNMPKVTRKRNN